jgi:hypothetical protein
MQVVKYVAASLVLLLAVPLLFGGCSLITGGLDITPSQQDEGFAIYLTENGIPIDKMKMQSHAEIADVPVITQNEIVSYDWKTHEIELIPEAWEKIQEIRPPVNGISFVVCVNKNPVY